MIKSNLINTNKNTLGIKLLSRNIPLFKNLPHNEPIDFTIILSNKNESEKIFYPHSITNKHYELEKYINNILLSKDLKFFKLKLDYYLKYSKNNNTNTNNKIYTVEMLIKNENEKSVIKIENIIKYIYFDKLHNTYIDYDEANKTKNIYTISKYIY